MLSPSDVNLFGLLVVLACAVGAIVAAWRWPIVRKTEGTFVADSDGVRELTPAEITSLEQRMAADQLQRSLGRLNAPRPMSEEAWARLLKDRQSEPRP